jgi:hypothetical protein
MRIRDPGYGIFVPWNGSGIEKLGYGINIPESQHWLVRYRYRYHLL